MSEENKINSVTSSVDTGTSIKFIGESDSSGNNLRIEDGKLSGTIVGSVIKDYTGRVDDVTLELANVPIDGVGGGPKVYEVVQIVKADFKMGAAKWMDLFSETDRRCYAFWCGTSFDDSVHQSPANLKTLTSGRKIVGVYAIKDSALCTGVSVKIDYQGGMDLLAVPADQYSRFSDCQITGFMIPNGNMPADTTTGVDLYAIVEG